jgi:hypothetical protein
MRQPSQRDDSPPCLDPTPHTIIQLSGESEHGNSCPCEGKTVDPNTTLGVEETSNAVSTPEDAGGRKTRLGHGAEAELQDVTW